MDAPAIQLIQDTAVKAAGENQITVEKNKIILAGEKQKVIDLERYMQNRTRFRGLYETTSIVDFSNHVIKRAETSDNIHLFINQKTFAAEAIYNYGTEQAPGHCDDRGMLQLEATAAYIALNQINGRKLSQKDLIDFIEDWNGFIQPIDQDGAQYSLAGAVASIRKITIAAKSEQTTAVGDFKQSVSAFDEIEAKADNVPAGFEFHCVPYTGLRSVVFRLRLSILTSEKDPVLVLRITGLEQEKENIAQGFKQDLLTAIGDKAEAYLGTFKS
jgi:uncharacterized protein YfdQ (DUF2303 family)